MIVNPLKGEVPLKLSDGREFVLVADHEGLVQAASAYGKGIKALFRDLQPPLDEDGKPLIDEYGDEVESPNMAAASRALLFGFLTAHHPKISLREASEILFTGGSDVAEALAEAVKRGFPNVDVSAGGNVTTPTLKPTGKRSGRSGVKSA